MAASDTDRFKIIVNLPMARPSFSLMQRCYNDYLDGHQKPCSSADNQCAVRMSTALVRCGFSLADFPDQDRIHKGKFCDLKVNHILGAGELRDYLRLKLLPTAEFPHHKPKHAQDVFDEVEDKTGILYFNNVDGSTDHIDLFDGSKIMNEVFYGGEGVTLSRYFKRANSITFFALT